MRQARCECTKHTGFLIEYFNQESVLHPFRQEEPLFRQSFGDSAFGAGEAHTDAVGLDIQRFRNFGVRPQQDVLLL